jgi:ribosomal protein S12 methylthiotransferase accessory factor
VIRRTPLADRVCGILQAQRVRVVDDVQPNSLVFADFTGLDETSASQLAAALHRTGCLSLAFWRCGPEAFYGPFAHPGRTPCWSCFRQRFADSLPPSADTPPADDLAAARMIAGNLSLALYSPRTVPRGCVLVENGDTVTPHSVLPVPWCDVCHFDDSSPVLPVALAHSPHIPQELRPLADPRGGIVRHLFIAEEGDPAALAIPSCCSVRIAPLPNRPGSQPEIRGEGKGATLEDAVRSAIGEGVERYAASLWHPSHLIRASFHQLEPAAFDPRALVLCDPEQYAQPGFPYAPFDPDRPLIWATGQWLDSGEPVCLPALATYMNFPADRDDRFAETTSNGLAAGLTTEDATLRALYELIERDAFMLFWLASRPAAPIALDNADPLVQRALAEAARLGARTELYLLDAGTGLPTVVCIGLGDGNSWPGVTVGQAAHADIDVALRKAVFEHNHFGAYLQRLMLSGAHSSIHTPEDVQAILDHGLYYVDPAHAGALDAFRAARDRPTPLAKLRLRYRQPATLPACVASLAAAGIRTAAIDLTSPDVRLAPLRVVRAFGTWMQPIHFGAGRERLNNPRLQRWLAGEPNRAPHPIA